MAEIQDHLEDVVSALEDIAGEIKVLREVLDEIRDDFAWALNNDKFAGAIERPRLYIPDNEPA